MMLVISVLLALLPLLGIVWIVLYSSITTVDGLFMSLILLAMSGIVGINVMIELRRHLSGEGKKRSSAATVMAHGGVRQRGKVESVQFYESGVGEPNKSIVTLAAGSEPVRTLVLEGDMRNALPVGHKVEVTYRKETGHNVLLNVEYP